MKLLGKNIMLQRSSSQMRGRIVIPEAMTVGTSSCRVVLVGDKVSNHIKPGMFVLCQSLIGNRQASFDDKFFCKENNIFGLVKNNIILPFGKTVLIRRDIAAALTSGGIEIPENRRTQSLFGEVVRLGISRSQGRVEVVPGDRIRLTEWQPHMTEIQLEDKSYGLIVNDSDLLYKEENQ